MTCDSALELLLEADPSEFSASERTPLGEHLHGCARCRRVAAQLMQDTRGLALAMNAEPVRPQASRVRPLTLIPAFAMAAIVFAVMLRGGTTSPSVVQPNEPVAAIVAPPVAHSDESPASVQSITRPHVERAVRRDMKAFARAVPLPPVRLAQSSMPVAPLSMETSGVTVTPPAGTRATVMHTSNPKLVVVWLY